MPDEGYNGWKNYPTWSVKLWLDNDQGSQEWALELVQEEYEYAPKDNRVTDGIWTLEQARRFNAADRLKDAVREMYEPDGASMGSDLLGYAFDCVEWHEIAQAFIEQVEENLAYEDDRANTVRTWAP